MTDENEKILLRRLVILLGLDPPLVAHLLQRFIEARPWVDSQQLTASGRYLFGNPFKGWVRPTRTNGHIAWKIVRGIGSLWIGLITAT